MSVQCNTYVMYGALLPLDSVEFEDTEDLGTDDVTVLYDGMGGKYVAIGQVFAKSGNYEGLDSPVVMSDLTPDPDKVRAVLENIGVTDVSLG